ncbi:hypothetical protein ACFC1T_25705 [Kitasatospora sp. NPDC056076]|uniref:hypothetical protein n=1 Tax=Kitasatospora sp. NPDC056076 TaxID=3345703 RepID=UPI0035D63029
MPAPRTARTARRLQNIETVLRLLAATGLLIDAVVHLRLADRYDAVTATISQGTLFRAEAAAAALALTLVLLWRRPLGDLFAWTVAASGLAALLLYRYVDVGAHGPLPDMYEPLWFADKTLTACAQAVAVLCLTALLAGHRRRDQ